MPLFEVPCTKRKGAKETREIRSVSKRLAWRLTRPGGLLNSAELKCFYCFLCSFTFRAGNFKEWRSLIGISSSLLN